MGREVAESVRNKETGQGEAPRHPLETLQQPAPGGGECTEDPLSVTDIRTSTNRKQNKSHLVTANLYTPTPGQGEQQEPHPDQGTGSGRL